MLLLDLSRPWAAILLAVWWQWCCSWLWVGHYHSVNQGAILSNDSYCFLCSHWQHGILDLFHSKDPNLVHRPPAVFLDGVGWVIVLHNFTCFVVPLLLIFTSATTSLFNPWEIVPIVKIHFLSPVCKQMGNEIVDRYVQRKVLLAWMKGGISQQPMQVHLWFCCIGFTVFSPQHPCQLEWMLITIIWQAGGWWWRIIAKITLIYGLREVTYIRRCFSSIKFAAYSEFILSRLYVTPVLNLSESGNGDKGGFLWRWTQIIKFESSSILYITRTSSMQELIKQGTKQKLGKSCSRCKKNTWHVESNYLLQTPKDLIIGVNRFRYINNNFTKDRCSIPMDMTVVLGLHKFSLQATIDHHGPSMYSGHYTASINSCKRKNILLQRQQNYGV